MTNNTSALPKREHLATSTEPQVGEHTVGQVRDKDKRYEDLEPASGSVQGAVTHQCTLQGA